MDVSMKASSTTSSSYLDMSISQKKDEKDDTSRKLSSGSKINSAKDDPSGLILSNQLSAQLNSLQNQSRAANDSISVGQVAEGSLQEMNSMMLDMRDLALGSVNGAYSSSQKKAMDQQYQAMQSEISRQWSTSSFGSQKISNPDTLNGLTGDPAVSKQITDSVQAGVNQVMATNIQSNPAAQQAVGAIDQAMSTISSQRAEIGAKQNSLQHEINNSQTMAVQTAESRSRVTDTDYAQSSTDMAKQHIALQTAVAVKTQAQMSTMMVQTLLTS